MSKYEKKQNPIACYLWILLYMLVQLALRAVALAPVAAFFLLEKGSVLRWSIVLTPLIYVFVFWPMRFSFASALVRYKTEGNFSFEEAFSLSDYGEKLTQGIKHAVKVFLWGLPLFAALGYAYYNFKSGMNGFALIKEVGNIGVITINMVTGVVKFFGNPDFAATESRYLYGAYGIAAVIALCGLIWLFGAVRNSAYRYLWAKASGLNHNPTTEARRSLRGRRWAQLGTALVNLLLALPFLVLAFIYLKPVLSSAVKMLTSLKFDIDADAIGLTQAIIPMVLGFFGLYMTTLPLRRLNTCSFAIREKYAAKKGKA